MSLSTSSIIDNFLILQRKYAHTHRAMITLERFNNLVNSGIIKNLNFKTEALREPLIEHVGHLPIIASYFHQFIEHKNEIDLAKTLLMLSVHDICETEISDTLTYKKTSKNNEEELALTQKLLPDYLYQYVLEMEERQTLEAKFAKSCDSLAPLLHDLSLPTNILFARFETLGISVDKIEAKKKPHHQWDFVLADIFDNLIARYREIEKTNSKKQVY